ncbi:SDR family oxidoreductase [Ferroplasma sp.]|uniref:SDR family oxidoreductase n=1 Tax=Ferroplasma sp. TaxID=2591003 RepID=UPI0026146AC8|nr:SDR family oxidoreductase [Ferroplasma sp.]MCL4453804.1 SDR family oxidoreductase [Candidatus Thermoplasmatota archaeon]
MSGKNILLAGTGELGKALTYELLLNGNYVIINSRNSEKLEKIVSEYSVYGKINYIAKELNDEQSCNELITDSLKTLKSIDSLVVMVGGFVEDSIENLDGLDTMILNHLKIPMYLAKHAIKHMNYGSSIIFVSNSASSVKNKPNLLSYSISKYALEKAAKIIALELQEKGIRVNVVAPEYIIQNFQIGRDYTKMRKYGDVETPPEDISSVITFLIDGKSSWINGAVIPVDGGHSLK